MSVFAVQNSRKNSVGDRGEESASLVSASLFVEGDAMDEGGEASNQSRKQEKGTLMAYHVRKTETV
ncbi:hypothetical protein TSUD_349260 [Trifolium subterraneum]|uniref:Uncharacterized protein n=1 Tax=Trifolium subterraneum TaxID=3900 RepID=A0A2Z6NC55_TRISU|nr:hypothetical protein TSUD_349260 [Trifolium subterraneum]